MKKILITLCSLVLALAGVHLNAAPLGTAFTYQGRLTDGGNPANGRYDLACAVYDDASTGSQIGSVVTNLAVTVGNGLFTVNLDFGVNVFTGSARWLAMGVRSNGVAGNFTPLNPRQPLTPAPYAIYAGQSSTVTNGAITSTQLQTPGAPTTGQVLAFNGTSLVWQTPGATNGAWGLSGNAGTTAANFIGTSDNQALELKVNGARALRLEPNTSGAPNVIGGSIRNFVSPGVVGATVAGGGAVSFYVNSQSYTNRATANFATVGGGADNTSSADNSTTSGGYLNSTRGVGGTISGGTGNLLQTNASFSTISGGLNNTVESNDATVGGGELNHALGSSSTLAGGYDNTVSGGVAFIGGGARNRANNSFSTISGGENNTTSGDYSAIGGGGRNTASGDSSTVGGGYINTAGGGRAVVGGGSLNKAQGAGSTVPGGFFNSAYGVNSFAAGTKAVAQYDGSFLWADSTDAYFYDSGPNTFNVRAGGGVYLYGPLTVGDNFTASIGCADFKIGHSSRRGTPGRALVDFTDTLHLNFAGDWANTFIGGNNVSVCTLTIRGGCDLAEPFQMKEDAIAKGSVVVIDEEHPGRLKLSTRAYDTQVAGIVSGANGVNPGIALHQEGVIEGGQNVALSGRVYAQADASSGPIKPGDLLTTSNTLGHAMKVTDQAKAQGAIIGKAMSALKEGKGMVLVLVTLQ